MDWNRWWRVCAHCGSVWTSAGAWHCHICESRLWSRLQPVDQPCFGTYPFRLLSLWHWPPREEGLLESLLYSLKGGGPSSLWLRFAREWTRRAALLGWLDDEPLTVVPAPSARSGTRDHAWRLAEAVSQTLRAPLWSGLRRPRTGPQKSKDLWQRHQIDFITSEAGSPARRVIFVDDLVTTGATALAAFRALGAPERFEVWSLCERSRLPRREAP